MPLEAFSQGAGDSTHLQISASRYRPDCNCSECRVRPLSSDKTLRALQCAGHPLLCGKARKDHKIFFQCDLHRVTRLEFEEILHKAEKEKKGMVRLQKNRVRIFPFQGCQAVSLQTHTCCSFACLNSLYVTVQGGVTPFLISGLARYAAAVFGAVC